MEMWWFHGIFKTKCHNYLITCLHEKIYKYWRDYLLSKFKIQQIKLCKRRLNTNNIMNIFVLIAQ